MQYSASELLLTPDDTARLLRVSRQHLARLRVLGGGPPFVKLSHRVVAYRRADIEAWVAGRVRRSTSDPGAKE
jgi:predicted DNA-binding transcriptional regulator AlpA